MLHRIPWIALCAIVLLFALSFLTACNRGGGAEDSETTSSEDSSDSTVVETEVVEGSEGSEDTKDSEGSEDSDDEEAPPAIPVEVTVLERGPMEAVLKTSATLEAESQIQVVSEAARRVQELLVEEGDRVDKGAVLLRLQNTAQRSALNMAQARLEHSQREVARQEELDRQELTTQQALSDAKYQARQDEISLADAERELGYTTVRAPIAGTVTQRLVNLGDNVSVGQPLFEIIDFDSIVARVYIPEKNLRQLAVGQEARIRAKSVQEEAFSGDIKRIAPIVDARTGTVKVTVAVGAQSGLRPGLYVDVTLVTAVNSSALRLPKRALVYDKDQIFAYSLGAERIVKRHVVIPGLTDRDFIEPLTGFAPGDTVIVAGQAALKDGSRVRVVNFPGIDDEIDTASNGGDSSSTSETEQP